MSLASCPHPPCLLSLTRRQLLANPTQAGLIRATQERPTYSATQSALDELNTTTLLVSLDPPLPSDLSGAAPMQIEGVQPLAPG